MCGIFGITSSKNVSNQLYQGLKKLEYRGYDSSGISGHSPTSKLQTIKAIGPIKNLKNKLSKLAGITCGIAHTRWATHGEPTLKNTHPHISEKLCVVHNGIIENHTELRTFLKRKNYAFKSDTDTEVIPHLLNWNYKKLKNMDSALIATCRMLEGSYAIGAMSSDHENTLFTACKGSPLIIGLGTSHNFIASDISPILMDTDRYMIMSDDEFAIISPTQATIFDKIKKL